MQGCLRVICAKNYVNCSLDRIKTFITSVSSDKKYEQSTRQYWKDDNFYEIELHFILQSIDKDDLIKKFMLLTGKTIIDSIFDTDRDLEIDSYVSLSEWKLKPQSIFCALYINKTI